MSDENETGGNTAVATPDTKPKRTRAPQTFQLCEVAKDESGNITSHTRLPMPPGIKSETPRREDILRGVRKALAEGNEQAIKFYANKDLSVVAFPDPVRFNCEVEVVEVRKVVIKEA
jgi:hypothetical protein